MDRLSTAAAFHGSAENPHYSVDERLSLALAALGRYEKVVTEIQDVNSDPKIEAILDAPDEVESPV